MDSPLTHVVIFSGAALAVAWLLRFFRAPPIVGFLCAGIVIGPTGFGLIRAEEIHFFAELGLVLLLFTVGLELSPEPLIRRGARLFAAGALQIGLTVAATAGAILWLSSASVSTAILTGMAVALSSTAIYLKQLSDRGETDTPAGVLGTGILLLQDICVILLLVVMPFLAQSGQTRWTTLAWKTGTALGGLVATTLIARAVIPVLVNLVSRYGGRDLMTLFAVFMACLGAWLADLGHWSWALGAFIMGILLAQSDLRHQLRAEITPFRVVFNALFFMSIGMMLDPAVVARHPVALVVGVAVTLFAKSVLTTGSVVVAGWPLRPALMTGIGLCTMSEFSYVLGMEAVRHGLLPGPWLPIVVAWSVGSMLFGAMLVPIAEPIATWLSARVPHRGKAAVAANETGTGAEKQSDHVIVVGYGLNGRNLAAVLRSTRIPYVVIEMNRASAATARTEGGLAVVGDATRAAILEEAGLARARALVVVIAEVEATRRVVAQAHHARPDLFILARTRYVADIDRLYKLGARMVVPEEFETSIEIFARVLKEFAVPDNVIEQQVMMIRAGRYGMLRGRPTDRFVREEWMRMLETAVTQTYYIEEASPVAGKTIRELDLRARTGVTIVAVTRKGQPTATPPPDFKLTPGDVLVLVGAHKQLDQARELLDPPEAE